MRSLGPDDEISGIVEAVSFDNTLREIRRVIDVDLPEDWIIPVDSIKMYEVIVDFGRMIRPDRTDQVNNK